MLSIRTQDRMSLVPYRETIKVIGSGDEWYLTIILNELTELGTYATQERALEVLDEIQDAILKQTRLFIDSISNHSYEMVTTIVYQIPKE